MIPVPSPSDKPLKPILKRNPSTVRKAVTFSATNSQVFFADDMDRSAVEVVSKLSYSDVLELKQLSLDSLPSDRHASMGLSPLLSHVPLTLCPLACEESKISPSPKLESRAAPPSPSAASSPLVIPDLSILASPASANETLRGSPPPPSPPSSEAHSSPSVSLGTISPHSSASSPESSPPKPNVQLTAPIPVRRTLMMNFMPLLPEPGSELPSPVLSAASSSLSEDSSDTGETTSTLAPQTPITPRTPHTPQTPASLSPIPASPNSPTSFTFAPQQTQGPPTGRANKTRASRAEIAQFSALSGSAPGELGAKGPRKSAERGTSPVSPISPASDSTISVTSSALVRPVPRRAFTAPVVKDVESPLVSNALVRRGSIGSQQGDELEPVARTKTSRSFEAGRLAIASAAWADGVPAEEGESAPVARPSSAHSFHQVALPSSTPTPTRPVVRPQHRSNSVSDTRPAPQPQLPKYVNPYAQIRENDEPRPVSTVEEPRQHARRSSSDKATQRSRAPPPPNANGSSSVSAMPQYAEDALGLGLGGSRPPPASMTRPNLTHRASVHGYPYSAGRPPSPTPQTFSRPYPSPLSSTLPLPGPQPRSSKPLASKDANIRPGSATMGSSYTLGPDGLGASSKDRKPRSANDTLPSDPVLAPFCAPMPRPKNSRVSR